MSAASHLEALEKRHRELDQEIERESSHFFDNNMVIGHLKKQKLQLREEIERVRDTL